MELVISVYLLLVPQGWVVLQTLLDMEQVVAEATMEAEEGAIRWEEVAPVFVTLFSAALLTTVQPLVQAMDRLLLRFS